MQTLLELLKQQHQPAIQLSMLFCEQTLVSVISVTAKQS